ncbi:MAG: histidine phosphatase family protein [Candidatus Omnitrophota bacterium]
MINLLYSQVWRRLMSMVLVSALLISPEFSYAQSLFVSQLPEPGTMVGVSSSFTPVLVKGMVIHPDKPLNFDFIVDSGDAMKARHGVPLRNDADAEADIRRGGSVTRPIEEETMRMAKYFLAAITVPEDHLWVNLSPYEKDRVIENDLGQTVLGRDMLAQDYLLKQLTASLIYPEKGLGKELWAKVYEQALAKFGTTDIPVDTFNKVWIMPDKAEVFEKGNAVYVTQARLKVMLDSDYVAANEANVRARHGVPVLDDSDEISKNILREIILPALEKEVNEGKNFAAIRQVFHAAILAKWYREKIQKTLLANAYVGTNKVGGVTTDQKTLKEEIYQRYIAAYKKGVFNYIKDDDQQPLPTRGHSAPIQNDQRGSVSPSTLPSNVALDSKATQDANRLPHQGEPRQYFSGGISGFAMKNVPLMKTYNAMSVRPSIGSMFKVDMAMGGNYSHEALFGVQRVSLALSDNVITPPDASMLVLMQGSYVFLGSFLGALLLFLEFRDVRESVESNDDLYRRSDVMGRRNLISNVLSGLMGFYDVGMGNVKSYSWFGKKSTLRLTLDRFIKQDIASHQTTSFDVISSIIHHPETSVKEIDRLHEILNIAKDSLMKLANEKEFSVAITPYMAHEAVNQIDILMMNRVALVDSALSANVADEAMAVFSMKERLDFLNGVRDGFNTIAIIKPDAVNLKKGDGFISGLSLIAPRIEAAGYKIVKASEPIMLTPDQARKFYRMHDGKEFVERDLVPYMTQGPVVFLFIQGTNNQSAVQFRALAKELRDMLGASDEDKVHTKIHISDPKDISKGFGPVYETQVLFDVLNDQDVSPIPELDGKILYNKNTGRIKHGDGVAFVPDFTLWYVRHGETFGNVMNVFQGVSDEAINQLNPRGKEQARAAALKIVEALRDKIVSGEEIVVIRSPAGRAEETSDVFLEMYRKAGGKVLVVDEPVLRQGIQEINFGNHENVVVGVLNDPYAQQYRYGLNAVIRPLGGESYIDVLIRSKRWLDAVNARFKGGTVIAFGHRAQSGALRILLGDRSLEEVDSGYINWRSSKALANAEPVLLATQNSMQPDFAMLPTDLVVAAIIALPAAGIIFAGYKYWDILKSSNQFIARYVERYRNASLGVKEALVENAIEMLGVWNPDELRIIEEPPMMMHVRSIGRLLRGFIVEDLKAKDTVTLRIINKELYNPGQDEVVKGGLKVLLKAIKDWYESILFGLVVVPGLKPDHAKDAYTDIEKILDGTYIIDRAQNGGIDIQNINVSKTGTVKIEFNDDAVRDVIKNGFNGFTPVIINIAPIKALSTVLGLE